jgi:LmbE family N-acetylglucosaminyl deacetylase
VAIAGFPPAPPGDAITTSDTSTARAEPPRRRGRLRWAARVAAECAQRWLCFRRVLLLLLLVALGAAGYSWLSYYQAWRQALHNQGFVDEMAAPQAGDRIVVFAPHPDDEVLGCGGVIQEALAAGAQVDVVLLTNGDASELALVFGEKDLFVSPKAMVGVGVARQEESLRALAQLGLPPSRVHFLSYPNNGLTQLWQPEHWLYARSYRSPFTHVSASPYRRTFTPQAPYCGQQVLTDAVTLLQQLQPDKVFLPHPKDAHPDHWATGCFVQYALATIAARGGAWAREVELFGYLIHWPRFPAPARLSLKTELLPPADLSNAHARWLRLPLPPELARKKLRAIRQYSSQLPNFDRFLLKFARANEVFERLSSYSLVPGKQARFTDRGGRRRDLGGAEVDSLSLQVNANRHLRANVGTHNKALGTRSYIALDLRGWDVHGAPVLAEAQVRRGPAARGVTAVGGVLEGESVQVTRNADGMSLGFALPPELLGKSGFFLSCWGTANGRAVDSVVTGAVTWETGG